MSLFNKETLREVKRNEIVKVAGELFCRAGYRNVSVEDISRELGLSKTILYYYFPNKHEIFKECHLRATDLLASAFRDAIDSNPEVHLKRFIELYVTRLIGDESPGAVLLDLDLLQEADRRPIQARREAVHKKLRGLVDALLAVEGRKDVDSKLAVLMMMSAINIVPRWFRVEGPWSEETVAAYCSRMFISGLLTR